jgi:hypothetical protein
MTHCFASLSDVLEAIPVAIDISFPGDGGGNVSLRTTLGNALGQCDFSEPHGNGNQLTAFNHIGNALTHFHNQHAIENMEPMQRQMLLIAYEAMQKMLAQAYHAQMIPVNNDPNATPNSYTARMAWESTKWYDALRLSNLEQDSLYPTLVALLFDKMLTYRQGGFYTQTFEVLGALRLYAEGSDLDKVDFWDCITEKEYSLNQGEIDEYTFIHEIEQCQYLLQSAQGREPKPWNYWQGNPAMPIDLSSIVIHPNPTDEGIFISGLGTDDEVDYELSEVSGRILQKGKFHAGMVQHYLTLEHLPNGVYYLTLNTSIENKTFKVVKR